MSDTIIRVQGLGKKYSIRHEKHEKYVALRDVVANTAIRMKQRLMSSRQSSSQSQEDFWALQDISFEVKQGDRIGIIGRNGAGKSTLLKILSRITEPTTGFAEMRGRVASLLEVGTGFHPELTGRENIFLNGAILGMGKDEIRRNFDEIVTFAEIEKFLDTPVKRYSSGMYVRLAFAVAAHLEPEILIVDEVLAVGDAQFQKKCLGKMEAVGRSGRTVIFVSHQMSAVEKLCSRGILINQGKVQFVGSQTAAISRYLENTVESVTSLKARKDRLGSGEIKILKIDVTDQKGHILEFVQSGQCIDINLYFEKQEKVDYTRMIASISVTTHLEAPIFLQHNRLTADDFGPIPDKGVITCRIPDLPLPPSCYRISYSLIQDSQYLDGLKNALELTVVDGNFYPSGEIPPTSHGVCLVSGSWKLKAA